MIPAVSVIIPTTCEARRWQSLQRAIASARDSAGVEVSVIVVVNGSRYDPGCFEQLQTRGDVQVAYQAEGSAPLAQRHGRTLVDTAFFAFLDDDDEYLPDALRHRSAPLLADPTLDFVASNGFRQVAGKDQLVVANPAAVDADPLVALAAENWLASCGGLFRSASVGSAYFDDPAPFLEWTYLAYRLGLDLRMRFVDVPTFRIYDTPASLSKSEGYRQAELAVLERIGALALPARVARTIRRKIGSLHHQLADQALQQRRLGAAWRLHLASLTHPGGWRYLPYSRKLLLGALTPLSGASPG